MEIFYECNFVEGTGSECLIKCGDGLMHSSEECDDGNLYNEDGCTEACTIENGYECDPGNERKPSECSPICGDGQLGLGEECDDGGKEDGDGCSSRLRVRSSSGDEQENLCTSSEGVEGNEGACNGPETGSEEDSKERE